MKYFSKITTLASMLMALCFFVGCSMTHSQLSPLNLSGVNNIVVESNDPQIRMSFSQKLVESGKFTVVSAAELKDWQRWDNEQSELKKQHQEQRTLFDSQAQATAISANNLAKEYADSEPRAKSKFEGNQIRVTGTIVGIEIDAKGRNFVRLTGFGNQSVLIFFNPSETSRVIALNRGNTITIIGRCTGRTPPDGTDISEISRVLGGGRPINIVNAVFSVTAPVAPRLKDYTGVVADAIIYLGVGLTVGGVIEYRIVRTRDNSDIGRGKVYGRPASYSGGYPHYDEVIDEIITKMLSAKQSQ